jgi:hypothetical protein
VTEYEMDNRRIEVRCTAMTDILPSPLASGLAPGPPQLHAQLVQGYLSLGVKWPGREPKHTI